VIADDRNKREPSIHTEPGVHQNYGHEQEIFQRESQDEEVKIMLAESRNIGDNERESYAQNLMLVMKQHGLIYDEEEEEALENYIYITQ
jgi:hypothetical protein